MHGLLESINNKLNNYDQLNSNEQSSHQVINYIKQEEEKVTMNII